MLRVPLDDLQPGMILARPIPMPSYPYRFLLQRNREIPLDIVPRLKQMGIREVWVRCRDLEFLEDLIDEGLEEQQREVYRHVRRNFENVMGGASLELHIGQFQASVTGLFDYLKQSPGSRVLLQKLDAFDNYLMSHSTNVCYLALLLGMKLERYLIEERSFKSAAEAKDVQLLGLGCLLHDVGKLHIPPAILNKPGPLTDDEQQTMRLHPTIGFEMVKGRVPPAAAQVVLNHHQRYGGGGYPTRVDARTGEELPTLRGRQIPIFARIATVVDVYDAATTRRCYSAAKLPVQVLFEMRNWNAGFFDPRIEAAFYQIIPPFPIGQIVTLNNGVEAAVVDFNPDHPHRPKVQGLKDPTGAAYPDPSLEELDLALYPELHVAAVGGVDVRPFQVDTERQEAPRADAVLV